jgi:hypothetical protein
MTKSKRKSIKAYKRKEFMDWAISKGYIAGGSDRASEAFRLINHKKGEIIIAQYDIFDKNVIIGNGRFDHLVSQWESDISHRGQ